MASIEDHLIDEGTRRLVENDLRPLRVLNHSVSLTDPEHQFRASVTYDRGFDHWLPWSDLSKTYLSTTTGIRPPHFRYEDGGDLLNPEIGSSKGV